MGNTSSLMPREICDFKKISNDRLDKIIIPERTENRHFTNLRWIIGLGLTVLVLIPFLIYIMVNSDFKRIAYGYDQCGNICGQINEKHSNITCSGQDMKNEPFLLFMVDNTNQNLNIFDPLTPRKCVSKCPPNTQEFNKRCIPKDSTINDFHVSYIVDFFDTVKWQLIICCLLAVLISMIILILLRYTTSCLIWSLLITALVGSIVLVIGLWIVYTGVSEEKQSFYLGLNISLTVVAICLAFTFLFLRKKITLVILLIGEATKSIFDMPQLIALPITTFIVLVILNGVFLLVTFIMISYGHLVKVSSEFYVFEPDNIWIFTIAFNVVVVMWLNVFLSGVEFMVVSGAVSHWYFTSDKKYLQQPIKTSLINAFKFHLGSAALGSLIIVLMSILRTILLMLCNNKFRGLLNCILKPIEKMIRYFSTNSYIVTAIHGEEFIKSGKRAARLLLNNLEDVISINYISKFVFGMIQLVIIVATVLFSIAVVNVVRAPDSSYDITIYIGAGIVAALVSSVILRMCDVAIDTLLICYCEDKLMNDGASKPFFASRNLLQFIEDSKSVFKKKQKE